MVEEFTGQHDDHLDQMFRALGDRTRRALLQKMQQGPHRVTDLAREYDCSLNAISKHLKILERAKLINRSIAGREHLCSANPKELKKAQQWVEKYQKFWTDRLQRLEDFVEKKKPNKKEDL